MKDSAGNWIAQPPAYEPIVAEGKHYNLIQILLCGLKLLVVSFQLWSGAKLINIPKSCILHVIGFTVHKALIDIDGSESCF